MRLGLHRFGAILLLTALLPGASACRTWQAVPVPAAGAPASTVGAHARLTRANGRVDEVAGARVERDTVRAEFHRSPRGQSREAIAVPLDSVRSLEVRRISWLRTTGLAAGVFSVFALLDIMFSGYSGG